MLSQREKGKYKISLTCGIVKKVNKKKQKQTDRYREKTDSCQRRGELGEE